jgi:hypothetical protein
MTSAVAFRNTSGILWESGPNYTGRTDGKIAKGTSPSIAQMDGGYYRDVFQGQDGYLWLNGPEGPRNQWFGLNSKSSPSIAGLPGGGHVYAFQDNTQYSFLWVVGSAGILHRDTYGMMAGTSPSITVLPGGQWLAAFQANTGNLWVADPWGGWDTGYPMWPGTSPSIAATPDGNWQVVYEEKTTGNVWAYGTIEIRDTGYGMQNTSNPSISPIQTGGFIYAFQANNGNLFVSGPTGLLEGNVHRMAPGTSPSVTALPEGGWEAAYAAPIDAYHNHYCLTGTQVTGDTGGDMALGSSPSISPVFAKPALKGTYNSYTGVSGPVVDVAFSWYGNDPRYNGPPGASKYRVSINGAAAEEQSAQFANYVIHPAAFSTKYSMQVWACYPNGFCIASNQYSVTTPKNPNTPPPVPTTGEIGVYFELPSSSNMCGTALMRIDWSPLFDISATGSHQTSSETGQPPNGIGWCWYNSGFSAVKPGAHEVCTCLGPCLDPTVTNPWFCKDVNVVAGQKAKAYISNNDLRYQR